jgi:hypothetical protein
MKKAFILAMAMASPSIVNAADTRRMMDVYSPTEVTAFLENARQSCGEKLATGNTAHWPLRIRAEICDCTAKEVVSIVQMRDMRPLLYGEPWDLGRAKEVMIRPSLMCYARSADAHPDISLAFK